MQSMNKCTAFYFRMNEGFKDRDEWNNGNAVGLGRYGRTTEPKPCTEDGRVGGGKSTTTTSAHKEL